MLNRQLGSVKIFTLVSPISNLGEGYILGAFSMIVVNLRFQLQVAFITQSYNCCRALLIVIAAGLSTASKQRANLLIKVTFFWKQAIAASAQKMHNITVTLGFYTPTSFFCYQGAKNFRFLLLLFNSNFLLFQLGFSVLK